MTRALPHLPLDGARSRAWSLSMYGSLLSNWPLDRNTIIIYSPICSPFHKESLSVISISMSVCVVCWNFPHWLMNTIFKYRKPIQMSVALSCHNKQWRISMRMEGQKFGSWKNISLCIVNFLCFQGHQNVQMAGGGTFSRKGT